LPHRVEIHDRPCRDATCADDRDCRLDDADRQLIAPVVDEEGVHLVFRQGRSSGPARGAFTGRGDSSDFLPQRQRIGPRRSAAGGESQDTRDDESG
jgi:hypothetical protein